MSSDRCVCVAPDRVTAARRLPHDPFRRAAAERAAIRGHAVSDGGRPDPDLRHNECNQSGAWRALHDRRLYCRRDLRRHRVFPARPCRRARRRRAAGGRARIGPVPHPLHARPPRPGAGHIRADPVLQRAGADRLGLDRALYAGPRFSRRPGRDPARQPLSGLSPRDNRGGADGRVAAVSADRPHPARHADPRRRLEPGRARRARGQRHPAVHPRVCPRGGLGSARRGHGRADLHRRIRDGRERADSRLCRDRDRRHRFDPRRFCRRARRRPGRCDRPRLSAPAARCLHEQCRRGECWPGAGLDVDLHPDGGRLVRAAARPVPAARPLMRLTARAVAAAIALLALALVPMIATPLDAPFYTGLFARVMIFAIAAVSLDLILGYAGLVSFGHAAYFGIGAYAVVILSFHGIGNGFVHFTAALIAAAAAALVIGFVSLRTSGVYFIMITLAFGQMAYFLGVSVNRYGGDDGLNISRHSDFAGLIDLGNQTVLYYFVFAFLLAVLLLGSRVVQSRFGVLLQGIKSNEPRMVAIGFPTFRYKLAAFVIAGAVCGLAGALFANLTLFVSPSIMHWTRSGEIMMMVILGGLGTLFGPVFGAAAYLILESVLSRLTEHWQATLGPILILVVLFSKSGD